MFSHEALLYDGPKDFSPGTALHPRRSRRGRADARGGRRADKIAALRAALGADAGRVEFARARPQPGADHPRLARLRGRARRPDPRHRRADLGRARRTELVECQLHESLLNFAFADRPTSGCCARTTRRRSTARDPRGVLQPPARRRRAEHGYRDAESCWRRSTRRRRRPPARRPARLRARHARRGAPARARRGGRASAPTSCWPSASWPPTASATAAGAGSCASGAPRRARLRGARPRAHRRPARRPPRAGRGRSSAAAGCGSPTRSAISCRSAPGRASGFTCARLRAPAA